MKCCEIVEAAAGLACPLLTRSKDHLPRCAQLPPRSRSTSVALKKKKSYGVRACVTRMHVANSLLFLDQDKSSGVLIDVQKGRHNAAARDTILKNTTRTRYGTISLVSVPARIQHSIMYGPNPQHTVPARTCHGTYLILAVRPDLLVVSLTGLLDREPT